MLGALISRGAADQIERIRDEHPHLEWLIESQRQAEEEARRREWTRHPPEQILQLAMSRVARLGRSGAELFSAVEDALEALDDRLQRHTPAVYDLWSSVTRNRVLHMTQDIIQHHEDEITSSVGQDRASEVEEALEMIWRKRSGNLTYRVPKGETALSDYIQRYLKRVLDEAIVSREVSVRPGNYTDLYISTFTGEEENEEQEVSVVVEVKGSWNPEVYKGIQNQLVENYLAEASCRFGLYFVGWHFCEAWSGSDPRKSDARRGGLESHEEKLSKRIDDLDKEKIVVHRVVADLSLPD